MPSIQTMISLAKEAGDKLIALNSPGLEDLDTGKSGEILYLLTLYEKTGDEVYLQAADDWIATLADHCRLVPSNNFGLFTGRGGFIYVLMQRYELDKEQHWLNLSLELVRPANQEFLQSLYTSDYLFDGRSGTLLLIAHLYQLTGAEWLLEYIHQFIAAITANANVGPRGVSWRAENEYNIGDTCGFAHGAAGIRYVFNLLNQGTHLFDQLIAGIDEYISSCWMADRKNWANLRKSIHTAEEMDALLGAYLAGDERIYLPGNSTSWSEGSIGLLAVYPDPGELGSRLTKQLFREDPFDTDLFDGMLAWALLLEQPDAVLHYLPVLEDADLSGGLMHGKLGIAYYLLKSEDTANNILLPFAGLKLHLPFRITTIRKTLLSKYFPGTVLLIEKHFPELLQRYFAETATCRLAQESEVFAAFVRKKLGLQLPPPLFERLMDLLLLEKAKTDLLREDSRSPLQVYLEGFSHQDTAIDWLNRPDEWLKEQTFSRAPGIRYLNARWDWTFIEGAAGMKKDQLQEAIAQLLIKPAGNYGYLLQVFEKPGVIQYPLSVIPTLLLQCFNEPKSVGDALQEIKLIFAAMPERALELLPKEFNHKEECELQVLLEEMDWVILKHLRPLIYRNLLQKTEQLLSYVI